MKKSKIFCLHMGLTAPILFCFFMILNSHPIIGQELHVLNTLPYYEGGTKALKDAIDKARITPISTNQTGKSATVMVRFMVNKESKIEQVEILRGIDPEYDTEAIRIVQQLTGWRPAKRQGDPINMYVMIPIEFYLTKNIPLVITGKISDRITGLPIQGALVIVKGSNLGTITMADGSYRLEVPGEGNSLEYLLLGYLLKEESINQNRVINVELYPEEFSVDFSRSE